MTVAELIARLQELPQDAEVVIPANGLLALNDGPSVVLAIPDGDRFGVPAFEMVSSDTHARRNIVNVRPVVVIE